MKLVGLRGVSFVVRLVSVLVVLPACAASSSFGLSGLGGGGSDPNAQATIPDVFKLRKADAIAAMRRAGVQADISEESSLCGSIIDGKIVETGEVCHQFPPPGRVQGARLPVSITVQTEDPRHGNIGTHNEWRLMPKLVGLTYEKALAEMRRAGFTRDDRLEHIWADETSCASGIICKQYPDPLDRVGVNDGKSVYVGQDRRPSLAEDDKPATPRTPTPTPMPTKPSGTQPTATPASADAKRWGGNGAPAYRDDHNVPHGPGGPVFMGRGPQCTNKLDHCLRPGGWFSTENVIAGSLFRGTPVFEFEGKWWNWRGEPVEYKFLYKTRVAQSASELQVGKPVLWFVEEAPKWLDSEYAMLTSSRWSVGVIESIEGETIRVKGWGNISLDSVRVIVEERNSSGATSATPPGTPTKPSTPPPGDLF